MSHDREARDLFMRMFGTGIHPNEFTFATVLTACVAPFGFDHGRQIHSQVVENGFNTHKFVGSSLLDMYAKAGRIHEARKIFNSLPEQDVVSCTAIIAGYAQLGLDKEALEMFQKLFNQGLKSNSVTYASILTAIAGLANLDYGRQITANRRQSRTRSRRQSTTRQRAQRRSPSSEKEQGLRRLQRPGRQRPRRRQRGLQRRSSSSP
ncbi:putative pentatricopeptide repeat-containing protein [Acorus calamus]|uniref:Pentatricopeptide repeat-containing protein n=1 Tax=Acorus calamus TaxID=4465 RepID=A0AAV9EL32_ACOCL|nr:putative pentatricopeptide repeat-containing protein [Acorus calamus]